MAMVERLTIIRGVEKFELQTKTARWVRLFFLRLKSQKQW